MNIVIEGSALIIEGAALVFFTVLAYWRPNELLFMLAAGASMMLGLHWYDVYVTNTGLTIGLMFIAFSFVCLGFAYRCIFWKGRVIE